jgi:hypothetical protein
MGQAKRRRDNPGFAEEHGRDGTFLLRQGFDLRNHRALLVFIAPLARYNQRRIVRQH